MADAPRAPRVLVLTLSFGSGHLRAAEAVVQALRGDVPGADVNVIDALAGCHPLFRAFYVWPYWAMVRYAPSLWDRFFRARLRRRSDSTAPAWAFRFGCARVFKAVDEFAPDVIVAAEVAASEIAALARRAGLTSAPVVNLVTDHHAEPAWVKPDVFAYAVASEAVRDQLVAWGAQDERVFVTGIPTAAAFRMPPDAGATRIRYGIPPDRPLVLLMGGGMGPTRMDEIAAGLCDSHRGIHVVAVAGHDVRMRSKLARIAEPRAGSLTVLGWVDDAAGLMNAASILVTKPGGLTTAEAAVCGVPMVMFDPIPGPEEHNGSRVERAGAGLLTRGSSETLAAVRALLDDPAARAAASAHAHAIAAPRAAEAVGRVVADALEEARKPAVLALTISNGAGHTSAAEAIASALRAAGRSHRVMVLDVADYMTPAARLTHVSIYLWLVRHAPRVWQWIDRYQKAQPRTSPEWYYRKGCRALFDFVRRLRPAALIATEVGCCEIAALMKRDLGLTAPLVAVNGEYDADRAWVRAEVDLHCVPEPHVLQEVVAAGAPRQSIRDWGVPLAPEYSRPIDRAASRDAVCRRLDLARDRPIVLVSGGSEALGRPDAIAARILALPHVDAQVIVLAGRRRELIRRCEALAASQGERSRLRVIGWTRDVRELMEAADLLVSKLGHTFDEAIATELPMVALPPPPGSEEVQFRLLESWGVGCPVGTVDDMAATVGRLLTDPARLQALRLAAAGRRHENAA
ncbi:MAG TPA: glycosyltransferase, partial [Vicinamibacterales bacterium]|nr:glycosyltransferase [Vicinamibacterales bacterium]